MPAKKRLDTFKEGKEFYDALEKVANIDLFDYEEEKYYKICDICQKFEAQTYDDGDCEEFLKLCKELSPRLYAKAVKLEAVL